MSTRATQEGSVGGAPVGAGLFFVVLFQSVPLLIGALVGGAFAG